MIIRPTFLFLLFVFFVTGCSSLDSNKFRDFLSDTDIEQKPAEQALLADDFDPVLQSTQLALKSNPTPVSLEQQINSTQEINAQAPVFDNVWLSLPSTFEFSDIDNQRIERQKNWYLKHNNYLTTVSKRAEPFLYLIAEEVEKRNLPGEIALLPIIESAFKPQAHSRQKAAGLWQFIPSTARHFGLKQNWWYDARRDVYQSTHAALTYLEQLNNYYKGDWLLTLAAYNAGAGNVNKAVRKNRKQGKAIDYWSLDLPRETENYVPKLIAIAQLIKQHKDYDITLNAIDNTPHLKLVDIKSQIDLSLVSKISGMSIEQLKIYNPAIKQWATDPEGPHHLLLPVAKAAHFETQLALVDDKDRIQHYRHKIRSGESLSVIANKYNLSIKALKKANHLKNNRIRAGRYLMVPLPKGQKIASVSSPTQTKRLARKNNSTLYTVLKGDSFWTIARKFNMSHKQLASINGLSTADTLSIGQKLTIKTNKTKSNTQTLSSDSASVAKNSINYKVKHGDSLYVISRRFKVSINELKRWNGLNSKKYLQPGQELKVYVASSASQTI